MAWVIGDLPEEEAKQDT